ncbi:NEAT domain-containing protein [Paenibacillus sp. 1P07SE]|uniref:NEAT domain-containing protein n=1 Tax=Paenibacillus sp. 1P07SE TaxID=3132209 RepID=UPI0039A68E3C
MTIRKSFRLISLAAALLVLLSAVHIPPASAEPEPLEDGLYGIELLTYSHGTDNISVMNDYIGNAAVLEVQGDKKTVHALVRSNNWIRALKVGAAADVLEDVEFLTPEQPVASLKGTVEDVLVSRTYAAVSFPVDELGDYNYEVFTHVVIPNGLLPFPYDHTYDVHIRVSEPLHTVTNPTGDIEQLHNAIAEAEQVLIAGRDHSSFNPASSADGSLQNSLIFAKAVEKLPGATPLQIATAHHYLTHDGAEFGHLYPATGESITIQGVHATNDYEASTMNSYLLYPNVIIEDGVTTVRLTLRDHSSIPSFKVEQNGELVEAATLSVDTQANTRRVSFPIASLQDELDAAVSISIGTYNQTREFRIIFNRPLDRTELLAEVTAAQTLHDQAVTGTAAGQYPAAAKTALSTAIAKAKTDGSMLSTQEKVDTAVTELKAAVTTFRNAVVAPDSGGGPVTPPVGGLTDGKYNIGFRILKNGTSETSVMDGFLYHPGRLLVQNGNKTVMLKLSESDKITSFSVGGSAVGVVESNSGANTRWVSFPVSNLDQKLSGHVTIHWPAANYNNKAYDIQIELYTPSKVEEWSEPGSPNPNVPDGPGSGGADNPNPPATGGGGGGGTVTTPTEEEEQDSESGTDTPSRPGGSNGSNGEGNETPVTPPAPSVEFTDTDTHWAYPSIARATQLGIINGYTDGTFKPNATVNRAEFAAIISRAFELQLNTPSASFSDWNSVQDWAKPFIEQAVAAGIINGYEDGSFRPGQQVSRTEIAVMIVRALGLPTDAAAALSFRDASQIQAYAQPSIAAAAQHGLIEGLGDNTFGPQAPATRAQAVTLILRALDYFAAAQSGQAA